MAEEQTSSNGGPAATPPPSEVHFSEGKSLSFVATNVAGPIEVGGLPPAAPATEPAASSSPSNSGDSSSAQSE